MFQIQFVQDIPELSIEVLNDVVTHLSDYTDRNHNGIVTIVEVSPEQMQTLNQEHRHRNTPTDVLSFHYFDDYTDVSDDEVAGEIILCREIIEKNAREHENTIQKEYYKMIVHSLFHLLGYDHETDEEYQEMHPREEKLFTKVLTWITKK